MRIHREGYKYIIAASLIWMIVIYFSLTLWQTMPWLFLLIHLPLFLIWFWILWFFRLPSRPVQKMENLIFAPADGKVVVIEETEETEYFKGKRLQVSIFMSPLNVHVNRNPVSGVVRYFKYHPGKYLVAWHPKSSTENERTTIVLDYGRGELMMRQIAGALARRIRYYIKAGDQVEQLEEFGFIQFGSRVDLFLPLDTPLRVKLGDKVKGGLTVVGEIS